MKRLVVAVAIGAVALMVLGVLLRPEAVGAGWTDEGRDGHSRLATSLHDAGPVHILESGLGVLPSQAGTGDALFLFPTHRPTSATEQSRIVDFVTDGGRLVLAADGDHAAEILARFGVGLKGFPAVLPPERPASCVIVDAMIDGLNTTACLPSPSALSATGQLVVFRPQQPVFLDIDGSGGLNVGDQGPDRFPMVAQLQHGRGDVILITDGDLWRNGIVADQADNLEFAVTAAGGRRVFLDSSSAPEHIGSAWVATVQRTLSAPGLIGAAALALAVVGALVSVVTLPIASPWKPHRDTGAEDPDLEDKVQHILALMAAGRPVEEPPET